MTHKSGWKESAYQVLHTAGKWQYQRICICIIFVFKCIPLIDSNAINRCDFVPQSKQHLQVQDSLLQVPTTGTKQSGLTKQVFFHHTSHGIRAPGKAYICPTLPLGSFPNVVFEMISMLAWLMTAHPCHFKILSFPNYTDLLHIRCTLKICLNKQRREKFHR